MKKTFRMMLALMLLMLGVTNASAAKVSLQDVPFCSWDGWTADAKSTGTVDCAWVLDEPTGLPYGDGNVINYADLSAYTKLTVTVTGGSPRFLLNRDVDEGQWNENEAESHLIDNTKNGWSAKYFSTEGDNTYVVDLKAIVKDKGFCHLHCIKGANWQDVTVTSMELEKAENAVTVGWNNLINNSDMEGDDNSSFFTKVNYGDNAGTVLNSEIVDGIGVNESRGIVVETGAKTADAWDNQFWFRFNEPVPAGTKYRVSFDYRADADASASTQAHAEPGDYIHYDLFGNINFTGDWQTFEKEGTVTTDQSKDDKKFISVAFNLNEYADANKYYFDNIKFEVYKLGTLAEFAQDVIKIDFGFDTNLPDLVKASRKPRLMFPTDCVKITVTTTDGNEKETVVLEEGDITSVEGYADGRFYVFLEDMIEDDAVVEVKFINPADKAYHLVYTSAAVAGQDVANFEGVAACNEDVAMDPDAHAFIYENPSILESEPENGSFNLPNNLKEFKVTFDKLADCTNMIATLNGKPLTVTPINPVEMTVGQGQKVQCAENIILTRSGDEDLATGTYTIKINKVYPEARLSDLIFANFEYSFYIGEVEVNPNDTIKDVIENSFAKCSAGGIPVGYEVKFGEEIRTSESSYGSGSRMFDFAEGGDFTKGLYFREGYAQYGAVEGYNLQLEGGKKYRISFNSAMWKDNGSQMTFSIMNPGDEEEVYLTQTINNTPNVNGSQNAVTGSTATSIDFVPEKTDYYLLRWSVGGFNEVILANVAMKYIPNTIGVEETQLLNTALANAKAALEANAAERYAGVDYEALSAAVTKYEGEKAGYTGPSKFKAAAETLDALTAALKDHRSLCDNYDTQIKKSIDVERQNSNNKFSSTALYNDVKAVNAKYHGKSEWTKVADPEDPEVENDVLVYSFDELTDNTALSAAVKELGEIANLASLLFTEGVSAPENANNGKATGVAVLFDRLRLGLETLNKLASALDVTVDSTFIADVNMALIDDDGLAEAVKLNIKKLLYSDLKSADSKLFKPTIDEITEEEVIPSYDMTVFVKNHNTYKQQTNMNFTAENVPGWTTPEGFGAPGLTVGWGQPKNVEGVAEDCMFQTWGPAYRVEQTITDLPAGVYTIKFGFGERNDDASVDNTFAYVKTSETPEVEPVEEGEDPNEEDRDLNFYATVGAEIIGQAFPFATGNNPLMIEDVVVTDGQLTIGVNAGQDSHTFFNDVRLLLANKTDFDYAAAYNEVVGQIETGVDNANVVRVRAVELYDLNGRRIITANKGIQIVKKYMSDGTVRIEKVVKK
jgi:hypothetical protein